MKPVKRMAVNKHHSINKFKHSAGKTKFANVSPTPMRGGIRL